MAKRSKIAQAAYDIAKPEAEKLGLELVDAEFKKEGTKTFLRLFIDKKGGLQIDDCETFSRLIDPILDEQLKHDADYFEVSSPGLTRPLTEASDFRRYTDEKIEVSLFKETNGVKSFLGRILEVTDETVVFEYEEAKEIKKTELKYEEIARAVRHIEF
ncbi:MAG: ribosome maturation factor RimP [Clostridiales bacterium]|nr:ribosome maturation factor RimP [Clostridiales bacterium]